MKKYILAMFIVPFLALFTGVFGQQISPSQIKKGSGTVAQILVTDTTVTGSKAGNLVFRNLSSEVNRIVSPQLGLSWNKEGNIVGSTDFIGSTNEQNVIFKRNGVEKMRLDAVGLFVGEQGVYTSTPHASAIPALTVGGAMSDIQSEVHVLSEAYSGLLADANGSFIKVGVDYTDGSSKINSNVPLYISPTIFTNSGFGKAAKFVNLEEKGGRIAIIDNDNSIAKTSFLADSLYLSGGNAFNSMRYFGTQNNFALPFITNNLERMRITQNGNIGIGTNAPTYTLDLVAEQNTASANGLRVVSSTGNALVVQGGGMSNPIATFNNVSGTEQLRISSTGNLGIGTNAPMNRLDIYSAAGNPLRLQSLQAGATTDSLLTSASGVVRRLAINQLGTGNFWQIGGNGEGGVRNFGTIFANDLPFITNNTERMRINTAGNVGIGTNNPSQRLEVIGNIYSLRDNGYIGIDNTIVGRLGITKKLGLLPNFAVNNTIPMSFGKYDVSNLNDLNTATFSEFGRFSNAGQFAVGTTTPNASAILEVASTSQGVLLPRMTTTQINAIASPTAGLIVYNITLNSLCFYDGTQWNKFSHSAM